MRQRVLKFTDSSESILALPIEDDYPPTVTFNIPSIDKDEAKYAMAPRGRGPGTVTRLLVLLCALVVTWLIVMAVTTKQAWEMEDSFPSFSAEDTSMMAQSLSVHWRSLGQFYHERILAQFPRPGQDYHVPPFQALGDIERIVGKMMDLTADNLGRKCSSINLLSLRGIYEIGVFEDTDFSHRYCVLMTKSSNAPWGTVIVNPPDDSDPSTRKNLSLDCPHPLHDENTGEQALAVFQGTNARSLVIAGVFRYTSDITSCQGGSFRISDAAHSVQHGFHAAVSAISKYFIENDAKDFTAFQFHGMGSASCQGVDAYLTHGMATLPRIPNDKLFLIWKKMQTYFSKIKNDTFIQLPYNEVMTPENPMNFSCSMSGSTNLQGRLLNGVPPEQICTTVATSVTGRFIHLEQKPWLRDSTMFPQWIQVLNEAHDEHLSSLSTTEP